MDRATRGINLSGDTVASNGREQAAAPAPPLRIAQGASHRVIGPQTTNNKRTIAAFADRKRGDNLARFAANKYLPCKIGQHQTLQRCYDAARASR